VEAALVRRILLVRPRFLGDICLLLPALDAVRAACPKARLAFCVEEPAAALLAGDPRIDERIVTPRGGSPAAWAAVLARLRRFAPEVAIDFFCNPRTALWTYLSGARVRVGYPGKSWRSALYTHHVRPRTLSAVEFHLASVAALGWPTPVVTPRLAVPGQGALAARIALLEAHVPEGAELVGFHPGARWPTRRWSADRFTALAARFLAARPRGIAVVTGGPEEAALAHGIVGALPEGRAVAAVGWPIPRLVGLQSLCSAFVSGDSGPLHTAVAAGTPTLALMSRNSPAMFFPYPERDGHVAYYARVECSPCHRDLCDDLRCLERLTVEGAWERLSRMLDRSRNAI
jgi:ADP-heptose:LPS heptosyltransferase